MNADHGDLDEVGGRSLDGGVLRGSFAERANVEVAVLKFRDVPAAPEDGFHIATLLGLRHGAVEKGAHAGESLEVRIDERLRLGMIDLQLPRKRVRALSVDRGKIDRLRTRSHLAGDRAKRHVEDDRGGLAMD